MDVLCFFVFFYLKVSALAWLPGMDTGFPKGPGVRVTVNYSNAMYLQAHAQHLFHLYEV